MLKKRTIENAVKKACVQAIPRFKENLRNIYVELEDDQDMSDEKLCEKMEIALRLYINESSDIVLKKLIENTFFNFSFFRFLSNPSAAGLPSEYTTERIADKGLDAMATFAACYFMLTSKPLKKRDYSRMYRLLQFQQYLINEVLNADPRFW